VIDRWGRIGWPFTKQDNKLLFVHVKIENEAIPAYIDTGGSHTFMDRRAYETLCSRCPQVQKLGLSAPAIESVQCSNGTSQAVQGQFTVKCEIGPCGLTCQIHVVDNQPMPILVGGDSLHRNGLKIDYLNKLLFGFPSRTWLNSQFENAEKAEELGTSLSTKPVETASLDKQTKQRGETQTLVSFKTQDSQQGVSAKKTALLTTAKTVVAGESRHVVWCQLSGDQEDATTWLTEPAE
jgi:hypothetical protein